MQRSAFLPAVSLLLLSTRLAAAAPAAAEKPGPVGKGVTLLPNGWRIAPAGSHLDVGDLPLAMAIHPDGRHVVITNNGWSKPSLRVVDLERRQVIQKLALDHAWLGLAWHPDGKRLYSSGAADNSIREVEWRGDRSAAGRTLAVPPPQSTQNERLVEPGVHGRPRRLRRTAATLYAAQVYGKAVVALDLAKGAVARTPRPARRGLHRRARAGRARALRLGLGRREDRRAPSQHARPDRRDRRSASTRTRCSSRRTAGASSSPAPTPTRSGWSTSRRATTVEQHRRRALAQGAARLDAERARALARRPDAPRRERRQQHGRGRGRHALRRKPLPGLHPHRLVSRPASPSTATARTSSCSPARA